MTCQVALRIRSLATVVSLFLGVSNQVPTTGGLVLIEIGVLGVDGPTAEATRVHHIDGEKSASET